MFFLLFTVFAISPGYVPKSSHQEQISTSFLVHIKPYLGKHFKIFDIYHRLNFCHDFL